MCHHVGFIKDDELEAFRKQRSGLGKLLDLFAYYIYTSVVGCIELQKVSIIMVACEKLHLKYLFLIFCSIDSSRHRKNCGRLPSSRWTIEQKVGQAILLDEFYNLINSSVCAMLEPRRTQLVVVMSLCETTSSRVTGRYFSTLSGK